MAPVRCGLVFARCGRFASLSFQKPVGWVICHCFANDNGVVGRVRRWERVSWMAMKSKQQAVVKVGDEEGGRMGKER